MNDVTRVLGQIEQGDPHAGKDLLPLVYQELRRLAAQKLSREPPDALPQRPRQAGPADEPTSAEGEALMYRRRPPASFFFRFSPGRAVPV
jgi:hypothetical protein